MPDLGDLVPLGIEVRDAEGELTNGSVVELTVTLPDGTTFTPFVQNPPTVTGRYIADYTPPLPGRYEVRWVSTSPNAAFVDTFDVRPAAPGYIVSLAAAKQHLNMRPDVTRDDEELRLWIETVTEVVERHRNEVVPRRQMVDFVPLGTRTARRIILDHRPVISVDAISNGVTTWDPANWTLDPHTGSIVLVSGPGLVGDVAITYTAGYVTIPSRYVQAAKIILQHLWSTQRVPTLGPTPTLRGGNREEQIITPEGEGFAIPYRAVELLGPRPTLLV